MVCSLSRAAAEGEYEALRLSQQNLVKGMTEVMRNMDAMALETLGREIEMRRNELRVGEGPI